MNNETLNTQTHPTNPNLSSEIEKKISTAIQENRIMIFVKGSPEEPMCGFSKGVMDIFTKLNTPFATLDVLADPRLREGIKIYTNWPTIPQVFIEGEFIGGYDIVRELYQKGELQKKLSINK